MLEKPSDNRIELEILEASYWEHYKFAKELAMYLPVDNPKRVAVEAELNKMLERLNKLKS